MEKNKKIIKERKTILITGASQGIGRCMAEKFARNGYQIVANYNKSEKEANELKSNLKKDNIEIDIFKADVSKREEVKRMIEFTLNKYGKIDVLINNAGISEVKLFNDVTDDDWNKLINNNLYSTFCVTQEVIPNMIHNKRGCIINISSVWGIVGASCETIYSITKAGIDAMTKSLAKELGLSGIRVNSIAPGFINTNMNRKLSEKDVQEIIDETPLKKIGNPEDIMKCAEWLINDNFTTGQIISINGGWIII